MNKNNIQKILSILCAWFFVCCNADALTLQTVANNVANTMALTARMITSVAVISGIGFVASAFYKFHQHKQNPSQVTVSQGIVLLFVGAALCVFPTIIPTFESAITGTTGDTANIWGSEIDQLIGGQRNLE